MPRGHATTPAKKAQILEMLKKGILSDAEIASLCNVCKDVVKSVKFCNGGVLKAIRPKSRKSVIEARRADRRQRQAS